MSAPASRLDLAGWVDRLGAQSVDGYGVHLSDDDLYDLLLAIHAATRADLVTALRDAIRALEEGIPRGGDFVGDLKATLALYHPPQDETARSRPPTREQSP